MSNIPFLQIIENISKPKKGLKEHQLNKTEKRKIKYFKNLLPIRKPTHVISINCQFDLLYFHLHSFLMTYSSSSPAASTLALPNTPTIFSTPSTVTTSTAAMDLNSPLADSHSGVLCSRIHQCKNTKNKPKDKSACTNNNNKDRTYPSTLNTNNKISINVLDESINDSTTKPGSSFPYMSLLPAHQNVNDTTKNTTTNSGSLGIQPSRLLTRKSLNNLSNSRPLRNTKNLSLNLNGISNNEVSPEHSEVLEDLILNLNNNSCTNLSISSDNNNNNVPITPSLVSAKLDLNNSNSSNSGIRPALALNNGTATTTTTTNTTITNPSDGSFSPVNNTALPFRKATLSLTKGSHKLSQQNLNISNSSSICTNNNSNSNNCSNTSCQKVPIAVQQQQPKLTRRRTMLSLSIPSRTTEASPSLNSAVDFPHRNLGDCSNNNLVKSSPTSPTSGMNNVSANSSNVNMNHKNISSNDFLNSASSERTVLSDSSSNYGENDMTSVLYRSGSAKYPSTATNNNGMTLNNNNNTNINMKNNSDNPATNTFSTQTILQDFSKLTLNDNFDENKLNAYPEGPADIYDGKLFLYSEPTAEQIKEFDVVINVAKEIKFPVILLPKSTVHDSITTSDNQHKESEFVFEPLSSNKNIYKRVNKNQNNNNHQQAKMSKQLDYYYVPWSHTSKLCLDFPVLTNIIDQAIHSKNSEHQDKKVLVHCQCGVSRSASLVIAYIMKMKKMILTEAYSYVKEKANDISPNMTLIFQLMEWGDLIGCGVAKSPGYYDPKFKDQQLGEPERIENDENGNVNKGDQGKGQKLDNPGSTGSNSGINDNNNNGNNSDTNNTYFERPTANRTLSAKNLDFAKPKISSPLKSSFDDSQNNQNSQIDKNEKQQQRKQKIAINKPEDHISATASRANKIFRSANPTLNSASTTTSPIRPQTLTLSSSHNNVNRPPIMTPLSADISNFSNSNGNNNGNTHNGNSIGSTNTRLITTTLQVPSHSQSLRNGNNDNNNNDDNNNILLSLNTPMSASFSNDDIIHENSDNGTMKIKSTTLQLPSLSLPHYNRNGINLALGTGSGGSIVSTPLNTSFRLQNKNHNNNNNLNTTGSSNNRFMNEPPLQTPMVSSFGFSSEEEEEKECQQDNNEEEEYDDIDTENDDTIGTIGTTGTTGTVGTINTIQEEHPVM